MDMKPPTIRWLIMSGTTKAAKYMSASPPAPNCQDMTLSRMRPMSRESTVLMASIRAAAPIFCCAESKAMVNALMLSFS